MKWIKFAVFISAVTYSCSFDQAQLSKQRKRDSLVAIETYITKQHAVFSDSSKKAAKELIGLNKIYGEDIIGSIKDAEFSHLLDQAACRSEFLDSQSRYFSHQVKRIDQLLKELN